MPRPLAWRQLVPGLAVTGVLVALIFVVFRYARVGALYGDTLRFYALTDEANALVQGSEVWLSGVKVGLVRSVGFAGPTADTTRRVLVTVDVRAEHREQIRRDSYAEIRPGGSFIGATVLMISPGSARTAPLADGDTLAADPGVDLEVVTSRVALASRDFPAIIANIRVLAAQLGSATSTVGAILSSEAGAEQFAALSERASRLAGQLGAGNGTIGRAMRGDGADRARHAAAELDTLRALLSSEQPRRGSFGRDSTLLLSVERLRDEVALARALLDSPRGTAGRARQDAALAEELTAAQAELTALIADIKARPFRYVAF